MEPRSDGTVTATIWEISGNTHLVIPLPLPPVLALLLVFCLTDGLNVRLELELNLVPAHLAVLGVTLGVRHQVTLCHARVHADHVDLRGAKFVVLGVTLLGLHLLVVCVPSRGVLWGIYN